MDFTLKTNIDDSDDGSDADDSDVKSVSAWSEFTESKHVPKEHRHHGSDNDEDSEASEDESILHGGQEPEAQKREILSSSTKTSLQCCAKQFLHFLTGPCDLHHTPE